MDLARYREDYHEYPGYITKRSHYFELVRKSLRLVGCWGSVNCESENWRASLELKNAVGLVN
jgi:hypothetical protein